MMQRRMAILLSLAAASAPFGAPEAASADAELKLGLETSVEYDDNVLYDSQLVEDDGIYRIGPRVQMYDQRGEFQWDVHYYPTYEKFFTLGQLDGWDHDAAASVTWSPNERTYLRLYDNYIDFNRAVSFAQSADVAARVGDVEATIGREGFKQNVATGDLAYQFLPRHNLQFSLQNVVNEGDPLAADQVRNKNDVTSGSIGYLYDISPITQAGITLQATRQDVERDFGNDSRTDFYNLGFQLVHAFSPTLYLSASAGPTLVRFDEQEIIGSLPNQALFPQIQPEGGGLPRPVLASTCPTLDDGTPFLDDGCEAAAGIFFPGQGLESTELFVTGDVPVQDTNDITYFANLSLVKRWRVLSASLRYVRDASTSGQFSGQVRDVVSFTLTWTPESKWRVTFNASWENRDQTQQVIGYVRTLTPTTAFLISDAGSLLPVTDVAAATGLRAVLLDADSKDTRYIVSLSAEYRLTKRVTLFSNTYYIRQDTTQTGLVDREIDRFDIVIGVRFYFDPIQLPI
jgi:hypothetical protein